MRCISSVAFPPGGPIPFSKRQSFQTEAGIDGDLFEHHDSLYEHVCFLQDLGAGHRSYEKLRLAAFQDHDFPELGKRKDWLSPRWVDRTCLGLVEEDHGEDESSTVIKNLVSLMAVKRMNILQILRAFRYLPSS